jgi:motility quorum-sensing regulator / GCU-specific mRNA interferase toxin
MARMWRVSGTEIARLLYREVAKHALAKNNQIGYFTRMEKGVPHCKLPLIVALIEAGKVRSTMSALAGGAALGFDFEGIIGVVKALVSTDFYKSMTTHADHRVWQDV